MTDRVTIVPALSYADPNAAVAFLEAAFGFEPGLCITDGDGRVQHAELTYGGGRIMLGPMGWADWAKSPQAVSGANTQSVHVDVDDVDAHCRRARAAGADILAEPQNQFYGHRTYRARDREGHVWTFAQMVREVSPAEMEAATGLKVRERP
ncbi:VOC family protein [Vineibacter terrae]|uniref:VOC family protein n=1 Tax=Vineibacter terrae TaxID=2586908 RepID=UPI002E33EEF7|nr:VOC family protein [Vineibacter terrae]HEX2884985.1 VOC family protein [Vineibacter terrae]